MSKLLPVHLRIPQAATGTPNRATRPARGVMRLIVGHSGTPRPPEPSSALPWDPVPLSPAVLDAKVFFCLFISVLPSAALAS